MSNAVFPVLPGLMWDVERTPIWSTRVQASTGGQELREAFWSAPIYRYTLAYELLRQGSATPELATLARFFEDRQGAYDSFLYTDPSDSTVSGMGFGVGDGATTAFQLQRSLGGQVSDALGTWTRPTIPTWNWLYQSNDVTSGVWTKNTGVTASAAAAIAPDGTLGASRVFYDGSGAAGAFRFFQGTITRRRGVWYLPTIWLRADVTTPLVLSWNDPSGRTVACTVTSAWQRFVGLPTKGEGFMTLVVTVNSPAAVNTPFVIEAWGAGTENIAGVSQTTPGPTIVNQSGAEARGIPAFYPAAGSGFDPIADVGAVALVRANDWQGIVPLVAAPRTNLLLQSQSPQSGSWLTQNGCTITGNATTAPDGTATAAYIKNATGSAASAIHQAVTLKKGATYTYHVWLRTDGVTTTSEIGLFDGVAAAWLTPIAVSILSGWGTEVAAIQGSGTVQVSGLTTSVWTHVAITCTVGANATLDAYLYPTTSAGTGVTGVYAWGFMLEAGVVAGDYLVTTTVTVTRTDYTVTNPGGVVTLAVAPAAEAILLWSGSFFWRCRFEDDTTTFTNFLYQLWANKRLSFRTVK